ncbi:MAG TPA: TIGR01459 family HAD-type hydrolase, partial [Paracoccaceae bacterium]|nr:TIGR01459 family HAD-type hydrolase [Paracoccaceae bacterium]
MTPIINRLDEISDRYDAMFVDLWGCVHNGLRPFPEAVAALQAYRRKGGVVMLLTNSPRPRASVRAQLQEIGVPDDCYDAITSS